MRESDSSTKTEERWVDRIDELYDPADYFDAAEGRLRVRIRVDASGDVEILADSPHTGKLDALLKGLGVAVEKVPCG